MSSKLKYIFALISLLVALYIYHFYRIEQTLLNRLWTLTLGETQYHPAVIMPSWAIYNLPEALWVFCATVLSYDLSRISSLQSKWIYRSPLCIALFIELIQYLDMSDGVYDRGDIIAALIGYGIALIVSFKSEVVRIPSKLLYSLVISSYAILILADVVV